MPRIRLENRLHLRAHEDGNDYLNSPHHGPVDFEITAIDLDSEGEIPKDLDGVYVRNGHNPIFQPPSGRYHWFDGDGMVHATTFSDGKATYRNRMVMTAGLISEMEAGRGIYPSLRDGFAAEEGLKTALEPTWCYTTGSSKPCSLVAAYPIGYTQKALIPWAPTTSMALGTTAYQRTPK